MEMEDRKPVSLHGCHDCQSRWPSADEFWVLCLCFLCPLPLISLHQAPPICLSPPTQRSGALIFTEYSLRQFLLRTLEASLSLKLKPKKVWQRRQNIHLAFCMSEALGLIFGTTRKPKHMSLSFIILELLREELRKAKLHTSKTMSMCVEGGKGHPISPTEEWPVSSRDEHTS